MTDVQLQGYMQAFADKQRERYESLGRDVALNQAEIDELKLNAKANQEIIDGFVTGERRKVPTKQKTLGAAIAEQLEQRKDEVKEFQGSRHNKLTLEIKTGGTLLLSTDLTGDPVGSYSGRQAISPGHLVNFRDLIKTTPSPTGTLITYVEGEVTNSFTNQTEGAQKGKQNYTWTEQKATSSYLSATTKFSKQLMYSLPFLQNTLTQELLRDFYKAENPYLYGLAVLAATGDDNVSGATVDAEEIVLLIANQLAASFSPSYAIVPPREWARILNTKPADYSVPGGFTIDGNGNVRIAGTPLIPAAWADSDSVFIIDDSQLERCETESLRVEFAFTSEDDWIRNLVCARIECFETLNVLRPESLIYHDMGNS